MATADTGGAVAGKEAGVGFLSIIPEVTKLAKFLRSDLKRLAEDAGDDVSERLFDEGALSKAARRAGRKAGKGMSDSIKDEVDKTKFDAPVLPDAEPIKVPPVEIPVAEAAFAAILEAGADIERQLRDINDVSISDPVRKFGRDLASAGIKGQIGEITAEIRQLNELARIDGRLDIDGSERLGSLIQDLDKLQKKAKDIKVEIDPPPPVDVDFSGTTAEAAVAGRQAGEGFSLSFLSTGASAITAGATALFAGAVAGAGVGLTEALNRQQAEAFAGAALGDPALGRRAGEVAAELYLNGYGSSYTENLPAVVEILRATRGQLSDAAAQTLGAAAFNAQDVFGVEPQEFISLAGQLANKGIAPIDEAAGLLIDTFQDVPADLIPDLIEGIDQYAPFLRDLGYDAEQSFKLLGRAALGGQYDLDKTGDALKEFSILATDGSTRTGEAFEALGLDAETMARRILSGDAAGALEDTSGALLAVEDPALRAQLALALFGTPLEDLSVAQIPDFLTNLTNLDSGVINTADVLSDFDDLTNDYDGQYWKQFYRQAKENFVDFGKETLLPALDEVARGIDGFISGFNGDQDRGKDADGFVGFMQDAGDAAAELRDLTNEYWPQIRDAITGAGQEVRDWWDANWPQISATAEQVYTSLKSATEDTLAIVSALWTRYGDEIVLTVKLLAVAAQAGFDAILGIIRGTFQTIEGVVGFFRAGLEGDWGLMWDSILAITQGSTTIMESLFGTGTRRTREAGEAELRKIYESTRDWLKQAIGEFMQFGPQALAAIGNVADRFYDAGREIVQGLIDGVKSKVDGAIREISGLGTRIENAFRDILDINSPSKVFYGLGEDITEGLRLGIGDTIRPSVELMGDWSADMLRSFASTPPAPSSAPGTTESGSFIGQVNYYGQRPLIDELNEARILAGALSVA